MAEEVPEGVMGGNAPWQSQAQAPQPRFLGVAKSGDVFEAFGPGQRGAQGDGQQVGQAVGDKAWVARILDAGEVKANVQPFRGSHRHSLWVCRRSPQDTESALQAQPVK